MSGMFACLEEVVKDIKMVEMGVVISLEMPATAFQPAGNRHLAAFGSLVPPTTSFTFT